MVRISWLPKFDPQYNFMATRVGQVEFEGSTVSCTSAVWGKYCGIKIILFIFIYNYIPIVKFIILIGKER